MNEIGTRTRNNILGIASDQGFDTRTHAADPGMKKLVTASCTFVNSATKQIQAANGTFTGRFVAGDEILVEGANLNQGYFTVTGIDATNGAYIVVSPSCKNEGPVTVTIRTP